MKFGLKNAEIWQQVPAEHGMPTPTVFRFEGHALDMTRGCLLRGQSEIVLRPKSFAVLHYLVSNANRLVSKEEIFKAVWPDVFVTDDSLTQCVREVRAALDDRRQQIIKTVPRRGYMFATPVTGPESEAGAPDKPLAGPRLSIAVLPFLNLSNDSNQEYLADGLTDCLTTDLSHIPGSFVIARSSAFTYKGKVVDARQIGRDLGVRYLIEGSIQKSSDRIRVNAQLIDTLTGTHVWAERYDRDVIDVLAVQEDIVCRIALSLDVALHEVESQRALQERAANPDATDLVMRAWSIWNRKVTPSNIVRALRLFEEALQLDPHSTAAMVGVARMNVAQVLNHSSEDRQQSICVAEGTIAQALDLDPRNALAHLTRGLVLRAQGKLEASLVAFHRAIELNPNEVRAYVAIGDSEYLLGHAEAAIGALHYALRLDPREHRNNIFAMLGWSHLLLGRDEVAIEWFLRSIHSNPEARRSHLWLACAYALTSRQDEALVELGAFNKLMAGFRLSQNSAIDASENTVYVQQRERLYAALRGLGVPD
ncbi:MAG: winged helix-turn-helix domain-containing tetratricopeptide repeat protein [Xanthobacteraceae bacterium]